jgi:hypothetical protein
VPKQPVRNAQIERRLDVMMLSTIRFFRVFCVFRGWRTRCERGRERRLPMNRRFADGRSELADRVNRAPACAKAPSGRRPYLHGLIPGRNTRAVARGRFPR